MSLTFSNSYLSGTDDVIKVLVYIINSIFMVKIAFLPEIIALHKIVIKYCHQDQVLSSILLQGVNIVVRTKYCHQNQILSDIERKSVIVPGFSESNLSAPFLPHHGTIPDKLDTILIQF